MRYLEEDLGHDLEVRIDKSIQRMDYGPFGGILNRDDSVIGLTLFHRGEDVIDG